VVERDRLQTELAAVEERSAGTAAITARLDAGVYLLGFEPDAGNGRAVVATGDPDTADNVVTFVPGTTACLETIGGDLARVDAILDIAREAAPGESTVGVTWFGYDAPQSLYTDAPREVFADEAQPHLRSFQEGLCATHNGEPSHNTVLAHSYGTTVVGHTGRCRNDAAFAALAGTSPLEASSGRTVRHLLKRGGDRALNQAVHTIAMTRMRCCPSTRAYVDRRRADGKTDREIRRCLKRYITRQLYRVLTVTMTPATASWIDTAALDNTEKRRHRRSKRHRGAHRDRHRHHHQPAG
jgi:hypothetical protein